MLLFLLMACGKAPVDTAPDLPDEDGDGHAPYEVYGDDCDDEDAAVFTGADETCDGRDEDCDLRIDEDAVDAPTVWIDTDGDGFGDGDPEVRGCGIEEGYADRDGDCYDNAILGSDVYPGAEEVGFNNRDDDCDPDTPDTCGEGTPYSSYYALTSIEEHSFGGYIYPAIEIYAEFRDDDGDLGSGTYLEVWWARDDEGGPDTNAPPSSTIGGGDVSAGCGNDTSRNIIYVQVGPYLDDETAYTFAARVTDKSGNTSPIVTASIITPD